MRFALIAVACSCAVLPAQKMEMRDGSDRQVVLIDVAGLLPKPTDAQLAHHAAPPVGGRLGATTGTELHQLAAFVRAFAPALTAPGADVQPLGEHHLVAMGSPVQVAAADRLLADAREVDEQFHINVRWCRVPPAVFARLLADRFGKAAPGAKARDAAEPRVASIADDDLRVLLRTLSRAERLAVTQAPNPIVPNLQPIRIWVGHRLRYVRDFVVDAANADGMAPVRDDLEEGFQAEVQCTRAREGTIRVRLQVRDLEVQQPLRDVPIALPGSARQVSVQVPHGTHAASDHALELASAETMLVATPRSDGSWLLTVLTVEAIR